MRKLVAITILVLATHAFAFQGRPVSDLRFDGRAEFSLYLIASDGTDSLILSSTNAFANRLHVFTQKIADGRPVGPQREIGLGTPVELAWTGSEYLAGWLDGGVLKTASLSREGSLISTPTAVQGNFMVADRNGALAIGYDGSPEITVQRLDLAGKPVGAPVTHSSPPGGLFLGPAAGGYGVVRTGWDGTWLMTFRADGTAITAAPVLLDGPYGDSTPDRRSQGATVATNGSDTMVVFGTRRYGDEARLKSVVVAADGTVKSVRVIDTIDGSFYSDAHLLPVGLEWDGAQYVAAMSVFSAYNAAKPVLVRIASNGERAGERVVISEEEGIQLAADLGWNGRELIVPIYDSTASPHQSVYVSTDAATMTPGAPVRIGRTLSTQQTLTIETIPGGYLAAWFDESDDVHTIRVSRLDAAGNYLDGEGIVVATTPPPSITVERTLTIDTSGPRWLLVWSAAEYQLRGNFLSRRGQPEGGTFPIGIGNEAAVRWNGTSHVVLRSAGSSLYRTTVSPAGIVGEEKTIAKKHGSWKESFAYSRPALVSLGSRLLAVYTEDRVVCSPVMPRCDVADTTVLGLDLDAPGAVPFTIGTMKLIRGRPAVTVSPTHALVTWSEHQAVRGSLLPAGAPEQAGAPFLIHDTPAEAAVAFDGHDFRVAYWASGTLHTAQVTSSGTVHNRKEMTLGPSEVGRDAVIAASPTQRPLAGFIGQLAAYDNVSRGLVVFLDEIAGVTVVPPAPQIACATRLADEMVSVRWQPMANVLGFAIELQLPDGMFRTIGVAPSDATTATVPLPDLDGSAVRLRAWNGYGVSLPSTIAPNLPAPVAILHAELNACAGVPFEVTAALTGTAPFTVTWSDGVVQTGVEEHTASRMLTLDGDTTLSIVSVTDASCEPGTTNGSREIRVAAAPVIETQSRTVRVKRDQTATLSVVTNVPRTRFAWYEGAPGDTSRPVGRNEPTFTTAGVTSTAQYWVRLTTDCGTLDSEAMTVVVNGRRRAVR
jgi:hypothetical protein